VALARVVQGDRLAEQGWEMAREVTPETAFATRVKLEQLRWYAGKLAPRKYGVLKPSEPARPAGEGAIHVYMKKFMINGDDNEPGRWSEEPAEHRYSMIAHPNKDGRAGEPLPPPAVIREPRSTQGPNATFAPNGGSVEAERDCEDDDYWTIPGGGGMTDEDWV